MKFYVDTREIKEAVATVSKALQSGGNKGILEGIYISAEGNELYLKCFDSSLMVETTIPAVIEDEGKVVLPGKLTCDLIRRMDGASIDFYTDKKTMFLKCGRIKGSLQFFDADEYPKMDRDVDEIKLTIESSKMKSMIRQTVFCASYEEIKPVLTGVMFEFMGDGLLNLVALDGYRLARRTERVDSSNGIKRRIVVPAASLKEISGLLPDGDDAIAVTLMKRQIRFELGETVITSRLLDGEFVNYLNILPNGFTSRVTLGTKEMLSAVETALLMARESKNSLIKMQFEKSLLTITANGESGRVREEIDISLTGPELEIAFNGRYFAEALRVIDDECVSLSLSTAVNPCVIEPSSGNGFYYLILPVRILTNV